MLPPLLSLHQGCQTSSQTEVYEQTASCLMAGLGQLDNRIRKSFKKILQGSTVREKAALSMPEREIDSIRADYKHKSPLCPLHTNLHSSVVQSREDRNMLVWISDCITGPLCVPNISHNGITGQDQEEAPGFCLS